MAAPGNGGETPEEDEKPRPVVVIGVHSRHANQHDDGSNIRGESDCIESLLDEHRQHSECRLVLMSDRPLTLVKLREQASRDWNCSVVTAHEPAARATNRAGADSSPPSATSSWLSEHGPYSGIGFYQDWALMVSHAHAMRGFVGRKRSSSLLVREVVEYDRMRHHQFIGSDGAEEAPSSAKPLTNCLLPY